jgi:hypothetical protein
MLVVHVIAVCVEEPELGVGHPRSEAGTDGLRHGDCVTGGVHHREMVRVSIGTPAPDRDGKGPGQIDLPKPSRGVMLGNLHPIRDVLVGSTHPKGLCDDMDVLGIREIVSCQVEVLQDMKHLDHGSTVAVPPSGHDIMPPVFASHDLSHTRPVLCQIVVAHQPAVPVHVGHEGIGQGAPV